jgi:16S rRNA U1498 N3-methylase RsmE
MFDSVSDPRSAGALLGPEPGLVRNDQARTERQRAKTVYRRRGVLRAASWGVGLLFCLAVWFGVYVGLGAPLP